EVFEGGICHTLASYVSMQAFPTFTESGGHLSVPPPAGTAATTETAVQPTTMYLRKPCMVHLLSPPHPVSRSWAAERAAVLLTRPRALPARPWHSTEGTSRVESTSVSFCLPVRLDGRSNHYFRDARTVKKNRRGALMPLAVHRSIRRARG